MKTALVVLLGLLVGALASGLATGCDSLCWAPQLPRTPTTYSTWNGTPHLLVLDLGSKSADSVTVTPDGHQHRIHYEITTEPVLSDEAPF